MNPTNPIGLIVLSVAIASGFLFCLYSLRTHIRFFWNTFRLYRSGKRETATVVERKYHSTAKADNRGGMQVRNWTVIQYKFQVTGNDNIYSRNQNIWNNHYGLMPEGAKVDVIYLPENPNISRLRDSNEIVTNLLVFSLNLLLCFIFGALFIVLVIRARS